MKRSELEHIIRASGAVAGSGEIVVVGSQAIERCRLGNK